MCKLPLDRNISVMRNFDPNWLGELGVRKAFGFGILAAGVVVLGVWASNSHAHRLQNRVSEAAVNAVSGSVHGVAVQVLGRDIHLSGIADGPMEHDALLAAADAVAGRRTVVDEMTVLAVASPFTLNVEKTDSGLAAQGMVSTEALRGALGLGDAAAGLTLAAGAPAGWGDMAKAGIAALGPMLSGKASLSDDRLIVTGQAAGPDDLAAVEAALAGVPAGAVTLDVALLDDGKPVAYEVAFDATNGAEISGKLPKGLLPEAIAKALGLAAMKGVPTLAMIGADGSDTAFFAKLARYLPDLERFRIRADAQSIAVQAEVVPGADLAALQAAMAADLAMDVTLSNAKPEGIEGAERINAATNSKERFAGGYWLSVAEFEVGLPTCQAQADDLLAKGQVNFLSGSDELDASALRVLNNLASVITPCATAGMKAEIGGHTDSSGDAQANLGLSQKRATAVRKALILRGVPAAMLRALGHGADMPIADNATDEGKALNRRTTITWSE